MHALTSSMLSIFKGPPHEVTYPLDYWKAGIEALANKNISRLNNALHGFTKSIIITFPKPMLQLKWWVLNRIDQTLLLCIFYCHPSIDFDASAM